MNIIEASSKWLTPLNSEEYVNFVALIARTCYRSEGSSNPQSDERLVSNLIKSDHMAMLEHKSLTAKIICDRGVSHEIVRHRLASFAQESTRYCNYQNERFGSEITVIRPTFLREGEPAYEVWRKAMKKAEKSYMKMIQMGVPAEIARDVLPTSLKTEIIVTANIREWRHIFELRAVGTTGKPHPQIKQVMEPLLKEAKEKLPAFFGDL